MKVQEIPFALSAAGGPPAGILRQLLSTTAMPRGRPSGEVVLLSSSGCGFKSYGFLLASTSPYFRKMLEQLSGPVITLITDLPQPVLTSLLTWLHQGRLPLRCDPLLASLIAAARKYNFPNLKRAAEKRLLSTDADDVYQRTTCSPVSSDDGSDYPSGSPSEGAREGGPSSGRKRPGQPALLVALPPKKRRRYSSSSSVDSGYTSDRCGTPQ